MYIELNGSSFGTSKKNLYFFIFRLATTNISMHHIGFKTIYLVFYYNNVSSLGLCGRDIYPKTYVKNGLSTFNRPLLVFMY